MSPIARWVLPPAVVGMLLLTAASFAQDKGESADGKTKSIISISDVQPVMQPVNDYTGTFTERTTLTGDWGGRRQDLLDSGFAINGALTQTFRAVAAGGEKSGDTAYNALFDYGITFDSARAGLWPGGFVAVNAQSAFASGLPLRDGAVSPSDYNVVFPTLERPSTELMEYYLIQGLSEELAVMLGRVNPVAWDRNRFAFDPRTQFMNGAISQQLLVGGLVSFSTYTASLAWAPNKHLTVLGGVYDPVVRPGEFMPFRDFGVYSVVEVNSGAGGIARFLGVYDDSEGVAVNERLILDAALLDELPTKSGNWMLGLNFEQYLWKPAHAAGSKVGTKGNKFSTSAFGFQEPGLGIFGRIAILPGSRNFFTTMFSLGVAGRGLISGRPLDRMGIAGYTLKASDELRGVTARLLDDEWGAEIFYNYAITPAIQASVDLQYNNSAVTAVDEGLVLGLRLHTVF